MIPVAIVIISLVALSVLHRPLIQLWRSILEVARDVSTQVENGLHSATEAIRNWWRRNFARVFTLRAFLGGIILFSFVLAFVLADYTLLVMAISSLFPLEAGRTRMLGLTLLPAGRMAIAIVACELLFGFLIFEMLGITDFIPWDQGWTKRLRTIIAVFSLAILIGLASITGGMAAWRTHQMQQFELMESEAMSAEEFDISANTSYLEADSTSVTSDHGPELPAVKPSLLDRLPTPATAAVGFIVPVATAVAGIGIYWLLLGLSGTLSAIFVLLPMLVIRWTAGIINRIMKGLYVIVACLLRLLAVPVRIGTRHLSVQEEIDNDSILSLETSQLNNERNNTRPPSPEEPRGKDDRRTQGEEQPDADSRGMAETASYTQDLEEEVAEYRSRDRQRAHNSTINPLGIGTFAPGPTNAEEEES